MLIQNCWRFILSFACPNTHEASRKNGRRARRTNAPSFHFRKITGKLEDHAYGTVEAFDEDVRAMLLQQPAPDVPSTNSTVSGEPREAEAEAGQGGVDDAAEKRKRELTAEFGARLEPKRAYVDSIIQARLRAR